MARTPLSRAMVSGLGLMVGVMITPAARDTTNARKSLNSRSGLSSVMLSASWKPRATAASATILATAA
ncbi:Uncharacterised protein [Bordetella pertussis]|nr:Uncharacterised protein [Bordetella pertussis]CFM07090.1 Uncharacterised protein [Bordetella pertussis]CFN56708.1 Uncharacterised protein [Bordetella pertussis]CFN67003.1 Uncharacterised protein [Bordetella pertussis]CFO03967.1 Uncharacterised protein [Bordetella pertussis]